MESLLEIWEKSFYTEPLLLLVLCSALIISIQKRKKHKMLNQIPIYIVSLLIVFISGAAYNVSLDAKYHSTFFLGLCDYIDYSFTFVEMVIFSLFYYQMIQSLIVKRLIIFSNVIFVPFFLYMLSKDQKFYHAISENTQSKVYTVEGMILLMVCLFYFIEMFKKPSYLNLKNEPAFWISTGVLYFFACTLPYSILEIHIRKNFPDFILSSYGIFYIFYTLLFLMIIRAYLCKPEKTI